MPDSRTVCGFLVEKPVEVNLDEPAILLLAVWVEDLVSHFTGVEKCMCKSQKMEEYELHSPFFALERE